MKRLAAHEELLGNSAHRFLAEQSSRIANGSRAHRHVDRDYGVGANPRVIPDGDRPDNLGSGADVHMSTEARYAGPRMSEGNLLEQQTIRTDFNVRMDDDAVRVWHQQSAANAAVQGDVRPGNDGPKSMPEQR
jgi:hypothetical protein